MVVLHLQPHPATAGSAGNSRRSYYELAVYVSSCVDIPEYDSVMWSSAVCSKLFIHMLLNTHGYSGDCNNTYVMFMHEDSLSLMQILYQSDQLSTDVTSDPAGFTAVQKRLCVWPNRQLPLVSWSV